MKSSLKAVLLVFGCWLATMAPSRAADATKVLNQAAKLARENNHREAVEVLKPLLADKDADGGLLARALKLAVQSDVALGEHDQAENLIEEAARIHPAQWRVLAAAGKALDSIAHTGRILDGKFTRSGFRGMWNARTPGLWASCLQRDHVRTLQLLMAARARLPADAGPQDRGQLLQNLFTAWSSNAGDPWKLQVLTDLSTLPEPETGSYGYGRSSRGYPVDADGNPVFFQLPASYDSAANDGERMRHALQEWGRVSPANAVAARLMLAEQAARWFGVHTVAELTGNRDNEDEASQHNSIAAVHTLEDDETTARLATGAKHFKLPAEYAFIPRLRELAHAEPVKGGPDAKVVTKACQLLVAELMDRRQFEPAATELKWAMEHELDREARKSFARQFDQITGNKGRFDNRAAQPAGTKAKLSLVFRNAAKVSLTARTVDVAMLLADTEGYLKSKPESPDWSRSNLYSISQRLLGKNGDQYLGRNVTEWTQPLKPTARHWDQRVELETPLDQAGAYWVEGRFEGGQTIRALLWIEGLTIVETKQPTGSHYFICDAVTGEPVPKAAVSFFGYEQKWKPPVFSGQRPGYQYNFSEFQRTTDAQGVIKMDHLMLPENYQWLLTARDAAGRMAFLGFERSSFYGSPPDDTASPRIYAITDRPVYRPGQEVNWKFWARKVGYDPKLDTNAYAGHECQVTITNQRNEKVLEKTYRADESGAVEDMLKLADNATLGSYLIAIAFDKKVGPWGSHSFRVEEYKKPEFEVKVLAPGKPVALGDSFEFNITAGYYFGGAVKEGRVKYKVSRTPYTDHWFPSGRWDWLFGAGYNWRSVSYGWYPGSQNWCVCVPRPPWINWRSDPPEVVAEGETAVGSDGTVKVKIDSALAKALHGDEDHRYDIEAEVTDNSRRTIFGKGSVLASRHAFETYAWLDRGWYQTGGAAQASISSRTLDGKAVPASGKLRVLKLSYEKDGAPHEEEVAAFDIKTSGEEAATQIFKWPGPGQYRLAVALKDEAGHESQTSVFTVVRGAGVNGQGFQFDDLELITEKEEYQPGDDVGLQINTNRPGSTVALFVRAGNRGDPVWLHLEGKSATYHFKLDEADQPNIFLEAYTVSDAKLHKVIRQVVVPPSKRIATVELTTGKPTYLPREKASAKLVVRDQNGRPFVGQVVITAYDKALEYISGGSNQQDIRHFFWGWKRSFSSQINACFKALEVPYPRSADDMMDPLGRFGDVAADMAATAAKGGAGEAKAPMAVMPGAAPAPRAMPMKAKADADAFAAPATAAAPVMIRSNLADSAVWLGGVTSNDAGEASIDFPMPDNLTTWKLKSWVMGPDTQVGEAAVEVITRKDLMVRLQAPRFFVEKDEVTLSANVHNELDRVQNVEALLEIDGIGASLVALDGGKPASLHASITAHAEHRFDWRLKTSGTGKVTVRVKALAQGDSDAMEMTFPVYEHGTLKTDSWSLGLRRDQAVGTLSFTVPEDRKPEMTHLEVRYSPTLAMALVDALPYLSGYPYGCTEQTLNRFVPTVLTLGVLKDLGLDLKQVREKRVNLNAQEIGDAKKRAQRWQGKDDKGQPKEAVFDEEQVMKMARAGLERLTAMRDADGGWGWFPGGRESSAHMTALVVHGLLAAQGSGLKLDDVLLNSSIQWLQNHEAEEIRKLQLPDKDEHHKSRPDNTDALVHSVLAQVGKAGEAMHKTLYEHRGDLSHYNLALLGLACDAMTQKDERDMCLRNLRQFLKQDEENQTAWLDLPASGWWWYDDPIETQAAFLRLLVAAEPKSDLAPRIAKYLLNNRRNGTYWNSTRDTATVIEALASFIKASGESKPDMQLEVLVDGVVKKQVSITKDNLFSFDGSLVLEGDELKTGKHTLEFRKQGTSPLYANAYLTLFSKEDMIPAAGLEVKVERRFYKLIEQKQATNVSGSRGQVVAQQGLKYRRTELASGDALISGDLVEVELSVESKNDYEYILIADHKPAGFEPVEVQSGWSYQGLTSFKEFRDEKVAFFVERLPRGRYNLSYRVKAEIPGKFSALPTKAEAMYAPELRGNAAEWKAVIGDR